MIVLCMKRKKVLLKGTNDLSAVGLFYCEGFVKIRTKSKQAVNVQTINIIKCSLT